MTESPTSTRPEVEDNDLSWAFQWARSAVDESEDTAQAEQIQPEAGRILSIARPKLLSELDEVLLMGEPTRALERLRQCQILAVLLPEVDALHGFHESCPVHHKDLWAHTLQVVAQTDENVDLRWAALMHDTGKIATRNLGSGRKVTFYRHEAVSAWLMQGVGARLAMPQERVDRIVFIIAQHARVNAYDQTWSDRALRRLIRDAGPRLEDLIAFASADYTTRRTALAARIRSDLAHLRTRIDAIREADSRPQPLPQGLGATLLDAMGGLAGPHIGEAIAWLEAEIARGHLPPRAEHGVYVRALAAREEKGETSTSM